MADDGALTVKGQSLGTQILDTTSDIPARTQEYKAKTEQGLAQLRSISGETTKRVEGLESAIAGYKPPTLKEVPPPNVKNTDPLNVWTMAAMLVAGLGSLKTRQPLTTAMNAAGQAIQSFHKGDVEAATQAFETWKVANQNAQAIFRSQMDAYNTILSSVERREGIAVQEGSMKERAALAEIQAAASAFNDITTAEIARTQSLDVVQKHFDSQIKYMENMIKQGPEIERKKIEMQRVIEYKNSPEAKTDSLEAQAEKMAKIHGESSTSGQAHKKLLEIKKQDAEFRLKEVDRQIDEVLDKYSGMVFDPTGITGHIGQLKETILNRLPYALGGSDETAYNDFRTKITTIRNLVLPLVVGNTYRTNPTLRAQMDEIVPGLERFESSQHMIQSLKDLKEMLPRLRGEFGVDEPSAEGEAGPSKAGPSLGKTKDNPLPIHSQEEYDAAPSRTWIAGKKKDGTPAVVQKP
jgi:hypothetical protein